MSSSQQSVAGLSVALPGDVCATSLHKGVSGTVVTADWGATLAIWIQPQHASWEGLTQQQPQGLRRGSQQ